MTPALLVRHFTEAGLVQKAVQSWLKAGQQQMARSAMLEAVTQLHKGPNLLSGLPDETLRHELELELEIGLITALGITKGYSAPEVGQTIVRARALAEPLHRPEYLVTLLFDEFVFHLIRSEHKVALTLIEQIEILGQVRNDARLQLVLVILED